MEQFIPPIFRPFSVAMAVLSVGWLLMVSLALHRLTRLFALRNILGQFRMELRRFACTGLSFEAFQRQILEPERGPDSLNDRALATIRYASPMVGFIGTLMGIIAAFHTLAATQASATLSDLAEPVASAMLTSIHGAALAILAFAIGAFTPLAKVHQDLELQLKRIWQDLTRTEKTVALAQKRPIKKKETHIEYNI